MEIIIQSSAFDELVTKLNSIEKSLKPLKRLPQLVELLEKINGVNSTEKKSNEFDLLKREVFDSEDVAKILRISTRTLQRLRIQKKISFTFIKNKCYYKKSEIKRLLMNGYGYSECSMNFTETLKPL